MNNKNFIIVVGMDYTEISDHALAYALGLATREPKAEVHAISVLPRVHVDPSNVPKSTLLDAEVAALRLTRYIESKLSELSPAATLRARVISHVRCDRPAQGIAQLASDLQADLIVVGTHGRHGVSRLLLGSVAEGVLRVAPCPVLIMHPKAHLPDGPALEPVCPRCLETRKQSLGGELWCEQHREKHGRRHTYHQGDRAGAETNFPLVSH